MSLLSSTRQVTTNVFKQEMASFPVGLLRLLIGTAAICTSFEVFVLLTKLTRPGMIHIPYAIRLPEIESAHLTFLIPVTFIVALLFTVGWHTRLAGATLVVGITYTLLYDQQLYSNHLYLLGLLVLLLTISDSGSRLSLDAVRSRARASTSTGVENDGHRGRLTTVQAWPLLLIKMQISVVYFFAAVTKLTPDYLAGGVIANVFNGDVLSTPSLAAWLPLLLPVLAYASIGVELFIATALWFPKIRWGALLAGVVLHGTIVFSMGWPNPLLMFQLTVFAVTIMAPYLLFFVDSRNANS